MIDKKIWITSDTHFNHANILKYCNRPFRDVTEMNETIIDNWNSVVGKDEFVYHLGDFCFGRTNGDFNRIFYRLNGKIIFIHGNHDKLTYQFRDKFYEYHQPGMHQTMIDGIKVTLCHYSMRTWNCSHRGAYHLYGHSHGTLPDDPNSLSFDVGVDCHNFTPISWKKVCQIMSKKKFVPIDHHGNE